MISPPPSEPRERESPSTGISPPADRNSGTKFGYWKIGVILMVKKTSGVVVTPAETNKDSVSTLRVWEKKSLMWVYLLLGVIY